MMSDVLSPNGIEIIHRRVEANRAGNVRCASLESMRRLFETALLEINAEDHLPAALIRGHFFQQLASPVQNPEPGWSAHFMAGEHQEIAADLLHIQRPMSGALGGINESNDPPPAGLL